MQVCSFQVKLCKCTGVLYANKYTSIQVCNFEGISFTIMQLCKYASMQMQGFKNAIMQASKLKSMKFTIFICIAYKRFVMFGPVVHLFINCNPLPLLYASYLFLGARAPLELAHVKNKIRKKF